MIAILPQFGRIAWRIGRFGSDFAFPNSGDRFYREHYFRMLETEISLFDNGDNRPAAEAGSIAVHANSHGLGLVGGYKTSSTLFSTTRL